MEDIQALVQELMSLQSKLSAYYHALSLLSYDGATYAPKKTAENRGRTTEFFSAESYKLSTGEDTVRLLEKLDARKAELDYKTARMVENMLKSLREMQKIPMDEYVAYQSLLVKADDVWHTAKETSDFALFEPYLEQIFETNIRFAGYCAPGKDPYDYWLNEYEEGLNMEKCDAFFSALRSRIVPLLKEIGQKSQVEDGWLKQKVPLAQQEALSYYLMRTMGLDLGHVGLATTEHPFTTSLGSHHDVRITTHYIDDDFASSMYSVIHEGGHALYDTNADDELAYTVLDGGVSMGIHESQSRFYENILGRSKAFCTFLFPKLQELFPEITKNHTAEDFYRASNKAQPSLIRTDADEVTYTLHVMVRYELEKQVMHGRLKVHDLPAAWNKLYKEYLGVDVPDDKHGVLQDSHWSGGAIGYFPSYALGSAYGAQFLRKMKQDVDVETCLLKGDFAPINQWNREQIWRFGGLYKPCDVLDRVLGEPFDPTVYTDYLEAKCRDIYQL